MSQRLKKESEMEGGACFLKLEAMQREFTAAKVVPLIRIHTSSPLLYKAG